VAEDTNLIGMTAEIAAAYVENNSVKPEELPALLHAIATAFRSLGEPVAAEPVAPAQRKLTPAQIRKSITPDALISFEDGKAYKMLRRHLTTRGLTMHE
jgi:predicted transcriptional regulator